MNKDEKIQGLQVMILIIKSFANVKRFSSGCVSYYMKRKRMGNFNK